MSFREAILNAFSRLRQALRLARSMDTTIHLESRGFESLDHSIPLIIHHASVLGDWIRQIEERESHTFKRLGTIIEWW